MTFEILYPERRRVTEATLWGWYEDWYQDGVNEGLEMPERAKTLAEACAALEDVGFITMGEDRP